MERIAAYKKTVSSKRRYRVIAKVLDESATAGFRFVKYRTNRLEEFIQFLKDKYGEAYYANFFHGKGPDVGKRAYTWGRHKGLQPAY